MTDTRLENSLDSVLIQIGDFGKYQIYVFSLVCLSVVLHSTVHVAYVYTALDLDYRCYFPECDTSTSGYEPSWLKAAVPYKENSPVNCEQHLYNATKSNSTCSVDEFDESRTVRCSSFVYKTEEKSIVQEYGIYCDENKWKLSMVGTVNNVGQFVGLFLGGILADKFGRKLLLILGMVLCGVCGLIRSLMPTYELFLLFEFLDAAFGSGTYVCGFILGVELVSPKYRVLTGILISCCYPVGEILTAGVAWLVKSWKPMLYILYTPSLFFIFYIWLIPDSVRWYISKGKFEEAKTVLKVVAKHNGKELSDADLEKLTHLKCDDESKGYFRTALKSSTLLLRMINCCVCWIACAFLFYGLTLNSVALADGNKYLDFILTSLVEIPAYVSCHFLLDLFGRRKTLCGSYLMTSISCIAFIFMNKDSHISSICMYLLGKFGATAAFTIVYVITSEMFPTNLRQSFMGTCSTFGRLGSMIAPQMPLLAQVWDPLPLLCFAGMAFIAGVLTLFFPETSGIILPDTIEEAENISKCAKKVPEKS